MAARCATQRPAAHSVTPGKTIHAQGIKVHTLLPTRKGVPCAASQISAPTRIAVSEADSPAAKIQTISVSTIVMTTPTTAAQTPAAKPTAGTGNGPERHVVFAGVAGLAQPVRVPLIRSASRLAVPRLLGRVRLRLAGPRDV